MGVSAGALRADGALPDLLRPAEAAAIAKADWLLADAARDLPLSGAKAPSHPIDAPGLAIEGAMDPTGPWLCRTLTLARPAEVSAGACRIEDDGAGWVLTLPDGTAGRLFTLAAGRLVWLGGRVQTAKPNDAPSGAPVGVLTRPAPDALRLLIPPQTQATALRLIEMSRPTSPPARPVRR